MILLAIAILFCIIMAITNLVAYFAEQTDGDDYGW